MIESTYSVSSLLGFVSSNRKLHLPPNSRAKPKFRLMDLACPMCRYPFGSGGKRVCTRPPNLFVFRSSMTISRTKLEGPVVVSGNSEFVVLIGIYSRAFAFIRAHFHESVGSPPRSASDRYLFPGPPWFRKAAAHSSGRTPPRELAEPSVRP